MKSVREILRLKFQLSKSDREIGRIRGISRTSVGTYVSRAMEAGIVDLASLSSASDDSLRAIIFSKKSGRAGLIPIDFEWVSKEMGRKHVTLVLLWQELSEKHERFYKYSRFCDLYREWRNSKKISLRIQHKAGEKGFIDYAGTTLPIHDSKTGEIREAQIFVVCLGASNYSYVEASWSQSAKDFIASNIRALEFFGGVPEVLVPDNLKSAVTASSKYEPIINHSFREFAKHCGSVVIPTRAYKPKDKAKVENGVLVASRWILARLRNRKFFTLDEANEAIWELLEKLNGKNFQGLNYSRKDLFEEVEKDALKELPKERFVVAEWKQGKANIDYHVQVEKCFYSVPYQLRGECLDCRYTDQTVEFFHGGKRIASHSRLHRPGQTSTNPDHMPRSHREHLEWSPSRMLSWGESIGPYVKLCFQKLMDQKEHPEQAYKACLGIVGLEKKYGKERLEKACERGLKLGAVSYRSIKSILEKGLEKIKVYGEQQELPVDHENIRGEGYYH